MFKKNKKNIDNEEEKVITEKESCYVNLAHLLPVPVFRFIFKILLGFGRRIDF